MAGERALKSDIPSRIPGFSEMLSQDNFAADVDLHTSDGHISLDMPITVEGRLGQNNIHGKLNGGGKLLTIHTGDGAIRLQKSMGTAFKFQMPVSGF